MSEQYQAPLKINGVFPNNKQEKRVLLGLPSVFASLSKQTEKAYCQPASFLLSVLTLDTMITVFELLFFV